MGTVQLFNYYNYYLMALKPGVVMFVLMDRLLVSNEAEVLPQLRE